MHLRKRLLSQRAKKKPSFSRARAFFFYYKKQKGKILTLKTPSFHFEGREFLHKRQGSVPYAKAVKAIKIKRTRKRNESKRMKESLASPPWIECFQKGIFYETEKAGSSQRTLFESLDLRVCEDIAFLFEFVNRVLERRLFFGSDLFEFNAILVFVLLFVFILFEFFLFKPWQFVLVLVFLQFD